MHAGASIDALDPQATHVSLLGAAISVGILQGLLHPLSGYPYAVLGPSPEPLGELENLILVHFSLSLYFPRH